MTEEEHRTTTDTSADELSERMARIASQIPGFPITELPQLADVAIAERLSHSQRQALEYACSLLPDPVAREAFDESTTFGDVIYWVSNGASHSQKSQTSRPPRGQYRTMSTTLRAIGDTDIAMLYRASVDPRINHRWRFRGTTPSPEAFRRALYSDQTLAQYMVVALADLAHPVGAVSAYNADLVAGHCHIAAQRVDGGGLVRDRHAKPDGGLMMEGMFIFLQYLFDHFDFRKIYIELPAYNRSLFDASASSLLVEEGRLLDYYWYGGRHWDQYIYSVSQTRWEEIAVHFRGEWPAEHYA
jgi:RimJ/RimL family protein N-acetyltransferase